MLRQITVTLSEEQIDWLDSMLNRSMALRILVQDAMDAGWNPLGRRKVNGAVRPKAVSAEALSAYAEGNGNNVSSVEENEDQAESSIEEESIVWSVPSEKG